MTFSQPFGDYPDDTVAHLHIGLWSPRIRHFAVLTGISGSGKTRLALKYAEALTGMSADAPSSRVHVEAVQPAWYDPTPLLGYVSPLKDSSYTRTAFLDFLMRASSDPKRPYVAILDEMNLSHPEQYFAPLLSAMETGGAVRFHAEGDSFDGNKFADEALRKGAAFAVIDDPEFAIDMRMILVDNVLLCLQRLARYHRDQLKLPILAITGTNGKTTTKELIAAVLSKKFTWSPEDLEKALEKKEEDLNKFLIFSLAKEKVSELFVLRTKALKFIPLTSMIIKVITTLIFFFYRTIPSW